MIRRPYIIPLLQQTLLTAANSKLAHSGLPLIISIANFSAMRYHYIYRITLFQIMANQVLFVKLI